MPPAAPWRGCIFLPWRCGELIGWNSLWSVSAGGETSPSIPSKWRAIRRQTPQSESKSAAPSKFRNSGSEDIKWIWLPLFMLLVVLRLDPTFLLSDLSLTHDVPGDPDHRARRYGISWTTATSGRRWAAPFDILIICIIAQSLILGMTFVLMLNWTFRFRTWSEACVPHR